MSENNQSLASRIRESARRTAKQSAAKALSEQADIPIGEINPNEGLGLSQRFSLSWASDDADVYNRFQEMYPNGAIEKLTLDLGGHWEEDPNRPWITESTRMVDKWVFKRNKDDAAEKYKFIDPGWLGTKPGTIFADAPADFAELPAAALPAVGGILTTIGASGTGRFGAIKLAFRGAAGVFAGEVTRRGINQAIYGSQKSLYEDLGAAAENAAYDLLAGYVIARGVRFGGGLVGKAEKGLPQPFRIHATEGQKQKIADIEEAKKLFLRDENVSLEDLAAYQKGPTNPITRRIGQQAASGSALGQEAVQRQADTAAAAARQAPRSIDNLTLDATQRRLYLKAKEIYRRTVNNVRTRMQAANLRGGDEAIQKAQQAAIKNSQREVSRYYQVVDRAAVAERPRFDLSQLDDLTDALRKRVQGLAEMPDGGVGRMSVSEGLPGEMTKILDDIDALKNIPQRWDTVKELRTRIYDLRDKAPWDWHNFERLADDLYDGFTEVLTNPIDDAPQYKAAIVEASSAARARFDVLRGEQVRSIVRRSSTTGELVERFGSPNKLDTDAMYFIDRYAKGMADDFKSATLDRFLFTSDASNFSYMGERGVSAKLRYLKESDPDMWKWLTNNNSSASKMWTDAARTVDEINSGTFAKAIQGSDNGKQFVRGLVGGTDKLTRKEADQLLQNLGGRGSQQHNFLRIGIWEDLLDQAVRANDKGRIQVIPSSLTNTIDAYQQSGVWDLLNAADKKKMQGLRAYMSLFAQSGGDTGTVLEIASAISQLKAPSTFVSGVREIYANKTLAMILFSKRADALLYGATKPWTGKLPIQTYFVASALAEASDPGEVKLTEKVQEAL